MHQVAELRGYLLLLELHRPLLPVCLNLLPELKALGWVPPSASADAAFLHMRCHVSPPLYCDREGLEQMQGAAHSAHDGAGDDAADDHDES
mgnify:CR=1 FL=1